MSNSLPFPQALLDRYFLSLRMNNWSPRTVDRRSYSIGRFLVWCEERGVERAGEITAEVLSSYRRHLFHYRNARSGKALKFVTQASYLSAISHWLGWLVQERWLSSDPVDGLELPKEEQRLPASYLTILEVESLINAPDLATAVGVRDRAIMETFYSTGMRRAELANLQHYDLDAERQLITIQRLREVHDKTHPAKPDDPKGDEA